MTSGEPTRHAPRRPFPAYAFLPGVDAHPTRDPAGHSYTGEREPPAAYLPAERWRENEDYLFGVDLYNHGYLWEAHEAWEGLWHAAKHDEPQAEFLQGLIQCAAGALKLRMRQPRGLVKLIELGSARLERVRELAGSEYMGIELTPLIAAFRAFAAEPEVTLDARPGIELRH